jgi:hypothetical protein
MFLGDRRSSTKPDYRVIAGGGICLLPAMAVIAAIATLPRF